MTEHVEPLLALGFAALAEPALVGRLAAELVKIGEAECRGLPVESLRRHSAKLVRRAAVPCGRRRRIGEKVLLEAARQVVLRRARAGAREDLTARFDLDAARAALAEARRCRELGIEVEIMPGYFRARSGKGWRPISWRRVPS